MDNYLRGIKASLNCLYDQKGMMIANELSMQKMTVAGYVDITAKWLDTLDGQIVELRQLFEAGNGPKH